MAMDGCDITLVDPCLLAGRGAWRIRPFP